MTTSSTAATYRELLLEFTPRPISSKAHYTRVMKQIDGLMRRRRPGRAEEDLLSLLSTLVVEYESKTHPAPKVSPSEMLAHLIEARGVNKAQVARDTRIAQSTITNVINGNRGLSTANVATLASYFNVSASAFIEGAE
jgi:HTH-type transcriptional regulator/antitoxin HigA